MLLLMDTCALLRFHFQMSSSRINAAVSSPLLTFEMSVFFSAVSVPLSHTLSAAHPLPMFASQFVRNQHISQLVIWFSVLIGPMLLCLGRKTT